jgi:hypothetical protein
MGIQNETTLPYITKALVNLNAQNRPVVRIKLQGAPAFKKLKGSTRATSTAE